MVAGTFSFAVCFVGTCSAVLASFVESVECLTICLFLLSLLSWSHGKKAVMEKKLSWKVMETEENK